MIDRDPYDRTERILFFTALVSAFVLVPIYFLSAPAFVRMFSDFGGDLSPQAEAFYGSGWLAGLLIGSIPVCLFASLFCARRRKRLAFAFLGLGLALATPIVGLIAGQHEPDVRFELTK